jgi:phospholipid-binding lipoprotein MlaA
MSLGAGRQDEDFGQTLGWWGIPPGPYLVLPLLGPSSLRDTIGFATDTAATIYLPPSADITELVYRNDSVLALRLVDERNGNPFRYYETGSPFEYDIIRFVYAKRRELEIAK